MFCRVPLFRFHIFADLFAHSVQVFKLAQFFGEFVVQLGQTLLLYAIHLHGIDKSLARQTLIGNIFGIAYIEGALLARSPPVRFWVNSATVFLPPISMSTSSMCTGFALASL